MGRGLIKIPGDTTRKSRLGEKNGVDFNYLEVEEFRQKFANDYYIDKKLEDTEYNGNNYGSPKLWLPNERYVKNINSSVVITPTSTETAGFIAGTFPQENLWIHLTASDEIRKLRLKSRPNITEEEIDFRVRSGDSIGVNKNADVNINTTNLSAEEVMYQMIAIGSKNSTKKQIFEMPNIEMNPKIFSPECCNTTIKADNVDDLVRQGIIHIDSEGEEFTARAGSGKQSYNVNYTLLGSKNRVHNLRDPQSTKYFARELDAYFAGSLNVEEGLAKASPFWRTLANENGEICSNYGHYVFHQRLPNYDNKTQFDWVVDNLSRSKDSRKAMININQPTHKSDTKDFPCTISMQFYIRNNQVCCEVGSRSTDVFTGLPYDIGFFSLVNELVYSKLKKDKYPELTLGYTTMKSTFTQIYDSKKEQTLALKIDYTDKLKDFEPMPDIDDPDLLLEDIYSGTTNSTISQWIQRKSQYKSK